MDTSFTGTLRNETLVHRVAVGIEAGPHIALGEFFERLDGAIKPSLGERDHAPRRDVELGEALLFDVVAERA
jgi:hypothetical protein